MAALFMYMCKNCGITLFYTKEEVQTAKCDCENTDYVCLDVNPVEYSNMSQTEKDNLVKRKLNLSQSQFAEISEEWKKIRAEVDREYYKKRLEQRNTKHSISQNIPKCPTCGSTNIKRITTANRAVSVLTLGILSGKIGKNYECLDCKAKW